MQRIEGFYAVYLSSTSGTGMALIAMRDGILTGSDIGGVRIDGTYSEIDDFYDTKVNLVTPPRTHLIQGPVTGEDLLSYKISCNLPKNFCDREFVRIETPFGPLNGKFIWLRGFQ